MSYISIMRTRVKVDDMRTWSQVREEWLKDPKFKAALNKDKDRFRLMEMLLAARIERKLTQAQLAKRAGMQQEAIARLESGTSNPSYKTLARVAKALDKKIALI